MRRRWIILLVLGAAGGYFASGVYFVQPDERAVVRWFGRVPEGYRRVGPGMHYALPWPMCRVDRPKTSAVRRLYVGLTPGEREAIAAGQLDALKASPASDLLTGDVNLLKATLIVQYEIADPYAYLFSTGSPDDLVRDTVQAVLIERLGGMPVDRALTGAKALLQNETLVESQRRLDVYGCGVRLIATNLDTIEPPRAIVAAFQDVVSATKDSEKAVERSTAEANRIESSARGDAVSMVALAETYYEQRVSRARGEAARFVSVWNEYRRHPELYRQRRLLEMYEAVLPMMRTYILEQRPGDPATRLRLIEPK